MAKVTIEFSEKELKRIQKDIMYWSGIEVTLSKIEDLLKSDPPLAATCCYKGQLCFDTGEREQFMSLMAYDLTDMDWPCGCTEPKESKKFWKKLKAALAKPKNKKNYEADIDWQAQV